MFTNVKLYLIPFIYRKKVYSEYEARLKEFKEDNSVFGMQKIISDVKINNNQNLYREINKWSE